MNNILCFVKGIFNNQCFFSDEKTGIELLKHPVVLHWLLYCDKYFFLIQASENVNRPIPVTDVL